VKYVLYIYINGGRDSSVGIATRCGLEGPGIETVSFELSRKKVVFGVFNLQWKVEVAV
jgi:hypothetical protein